MTKELFEVILKMKQNLFNSQGIELTKKELSLVMRYINELENEVTGDID